MLKIERKTDSRVNKAILHRVADIPGGVTVSVASLGGDTLQEGTPLCVGSNGLYEVVKTAAVVTAYASGTSLEVSKGSHFKVGDEIVDEAGTVSGVIAAIDKSTNADKDVITLEEAFAKGLAKGALIVLDGQGNAIAIAGSNYTVKPNDNLFVDAWVIGVVREGNAPVVTAAIKSQISGIRYV